MTLRPPPSSASAPTSRNRPVRLCGEPAPEPGHVCAFFDSTKEKYDVIAEYFQDAIGAGDQLINIVEADAMAEHIRQLERRDVPVREAVQSKRLTLSDAESTYLKDGTVGVDAVFQLVRETLARAERDGQRVRTCGDMAWISRAPDSLDAVMAYEARINLLLPACQCTMLCLYDLSRMPAFLVADVLATHEYAIMNGRLRRNPYFVPPTEYLDMLSRRQVQ